jgi:hypothetical protein
MAASISATRLGVLSLRNLTLTCNARSVEVLRPDRRPIGFRVVDEEGAPPETCDRRTVARAVSRNPVFLGLSERGTLGHRLQPESLEVFLSGALCRPAQPLR